MTAIKSGWEKYVIWSKTIYEIYYEINKLDIKNTQDLSDSEEIIKDKRYFDKSKGDMCEILQKIKPDHHFFKLKKTFPETEGWKLTIRQLRNVAFQNEIDLLYCPQYKANIYEEIRKHIPHNPLFLLKNSRDLLGDFLDNYKGGKNFNNKRRLWIIEKFTSAFPHSLILKTIEEKTALEKVFNTCANTQVILTVLDTEKKYYDEISYEIIREMELKKASDEFDKLQIDLKEETGEDFLKN
ncbi:hypothetical protein OAG24_00170 [bacterium]|nr:hypothetical protein [bacterium]